MTIKRKIAYIDKEFEEKARKAFPHYKSMCAITKQLNKVLEEIIYEKDFEKKKR